MNLHDIKQISIVDYLRQAGYTPVRTQGIHYWYCSPLRQERTASFKVNTERNQWYDFGTGEHGDIIDLVCRLENRSTAEVLWQLSAKNSATTTHFVSSGRIESQHKPSQGMELISVQPITHLKLVHYLSSRGLNLCDVSSFLSEINYKVSDKIYFALGFPNDAGGWELRNPYFKGCLAPKAVSTIKGKNESHQSVLLFEGFMDFLSWRKVHPETETDCMVLNSLALLPKVLSVLSEYSAIECFLDNDDAGRNAIASIVRTGIKVKDMSELYAPYKDMNEWLVAQSKVKEKQPFLPTTKRGIRR